ncbi:MAG: hypothetical protein NTY19_37030 [Planctomycetota bacterium]|nr:hypothetical protein [Planctomycetota bacterium]
MGKKEQPKPAQPKFQKPDYAVTIDGINELILRVNAGDEPAFYELREILWNDSGAWIVENLGNVAGQARKAMEERISRGQKAFLSAIQMKVDHLRKELEGPQPTPVEKLLVERVLATWLQAAEADLTDARTTN